MNKIYINGQELNEDHISVDGVEINKTEDEVNLIVENLEKKRFRPLKKAFIDFAWTLLFTAIVLGVFYLITKKVTFEMALACLTFQLGVLWGRIADWLKK